MNIETQLEFDFMKPEQYTLNFDKNFYSYTSITFTDRSNSVVGKLDWSDGTLKFEGEADESAQLFFDNIIKGHVQMQLPIFTKTTWKS
jgi:hypothetical protein